MGDLQEAALIRMRILGALLADARQSSARTVEECAELIGISIDDYSSFEAGNSSPALPQLEALAYYFNVPLQHFWGDETVAVARKEDEIKSSISQMTAIRNKLIGATLRSLREEAMMTVEQVAEQTGLSVSQIEAHELGTTSIPVHELETITRGLKVSIDELVDSHGSVGSWLQLQTEFTEFAELPREMREFVLKPINRSYLELAMHLSGLPVQRLRGVAESILEITF